MTRKAHPSDVSDEEWAFVAPCLTLMDEAAPQGGARHAVPLPARCLQRTALHAAHGRPWRIPPNDAPLWQVAYQQTQRWLKAGVFAQLAPDVRMLLRATTDRTPQTRAVIVDSRMLQSTPERGGRAGDDGHKRRKGSKVHLAVDTLGQLLAVVVIPANEQDRAHAAALAQRMQEVTGDTVDAAFVDQGATGAHPAAEDAAHGMRLDAVTLPTARRRVVVLPRRWSVERRFAWMTHFRRLTTNASRRRWPGCMSSPLPSCWPIGLSLS